MKNSDYIKVNRKVSREVELSYENGWKCVRKVHRSKKEYRRVEKYGNKYEI